MNRFVLTPAAEGDLLKIIEYLEGENPSAVLKVVDALDEAERISDYIAEHRPVTARRIALDIVRSVDALDTFPNRGRQGRVEGRIIYIELTAAGPRTHREEVLDRAAAAELNPPGPIRL